MNNVAERGLKKIETETERERESIYIMVLSTSHLSG